MCTSHETLRLLALTADHVLGFSVATQPGRKRSLGSGLPQLLSLRAVDDTVAPEALLHGEGFSTASMGASKRTGLLVEGVDVALQVENSGE